MLSQNLLNPNAEPFYLKPRQQLLLAPSSASYQFPLITLGYWLPIHASTLEPIHNVNVKKGSTVRKKVFVKEHRRCYRTEWRVKDKKLLENATTLRRTVIPFPNSVEEAEIAPITTIMIRNIPNQFKFADLLLILDKHCFQQNKDVDPTNWSKFDFVYLPMDFRKHAIENRMSNLGYAFVNFTTPAAAFKFYSEFQGHEWNVPQNKKICEINAAQYQGKDTLIRIFERKHFRCKSRDFLPVVFSQGRDGLNRRFDGTFLGKHVWGLPTRTIRTGRFLP